MRSGILSPLKTYSSLIKIIQGVACGSNRIILKMLKSDLEIPVIGIVIPWMTICSDGDELPMRMRDIDTQRVGMVFQQ
jgi:hypothetical protein